MWVKNLFLIKVLNSFLSDLATPKNLLWWWNFGFTSGISILIQVFRGLILALLYCDYVNYAFISAEYLIDEINNGYTLRLIHPRGARMLFSLIFTHIGRRLWYKSFIILEVWSTGVIIFLVLMIVSFLGYVLPWGQISFWAATVITNLLYVTPYLGSQLLEVVWGGFRVGGPTLSRFFILHYTIPFVILLIRVIHLVFLHLSGSSNPIGIITRSEKIELYWYFFLKDLYFIFLVVIIFEFVLFLSPFFFIDSENFLVVDFIKTPEHTKPERYFLFAYCISRRVPNKAGGVLGLVIRILILFLVPFVAHRRLKFVDIYSVYRKVFLFLSLIMLTWLGGCLVEWPHRNLGMIISAIYFMIIF